MENKTEKPYKITGNEVFVNIDYREEVKWKLPLALFIITIFTTICSGAFFEGYNPFKEPQYFLKGVPFSVSLILILGCHEFGHFFASRHHKVNATLPFFIPSPPVPPLLGTFGAVIKIKSPIRTKEALTDIGASGPIAGFIVAVILSFIGIYLSPVINSHSSEGTLSLGSSIIFEVVTYIVKGDLGDNSDILLHPIAFAAWLGFFVTSLNLIPVGQLDGGHILYAYNSKAHTYMSKFLVIFLLILGYFTWLGWSLWAVIIFLIGTKHPPVVNEEDELQKKRKIVAYVNLLLFILTFTPTPFYIT